MKRILYFILSLLFLILPLPVHADNAGLDVHFLNVGEGDAAIIVCDGHAMMIDGGEQGKSSNVYSYLTNTLHIKHLDYIIATHPHDDHIGGISGALNACTVGAVYSSVAEHDSAAFFSMTRHTERQGITVMVPEQGHKFVLGSSIVEFLSTGKTYSKTNDTSLVVRITYGNTSFLFTGDIESDAEIDLIRNGHVSADVLKVAHHGSSTSTSSAFLRSVSPQYAVISAGVDNSDHPNDETIQRLEDDGVIVYRTDLHGHIVCHSDGNVITFDTETLALPENADPTNLPQYIGNRKTKKIHDSHCRSVETMKETNKVGYRILEDALEDGYVPCKNCNPAQ